MSKYILVLLLTLSACSTPLTTLSKGKDVQQCGGGTAGSMFGGFTGYRIQEGHDAECVERLKAQGYKVQ